jgi:uncharacterized protein (DUF2336 family)
MVRESRRQGMAAMIIGAFLRWTERATAGDRAKAAASLTRAFLKGSMSAEDRRAAEAALTFLLDDPSPKVRLAMAREMAGSLDAPRTMVHALARDQIEVASHIVGFSPVLSDGDLIDIVGDCMPEVQRVVAMRPGLSVAVSAALAEVGHVRSVCDLLENDRASIAGISLRRIVARFGGEPAVRARLLERDSLPCDVRHQLVLDIGLALARSEFVKRTIGDGRLHRITRDACQQATLQIAADVPAEELPALVEHLRISGELTTAFLMHALCQGNIDLYAAALVSLSGQSPARVRSIIVDGRIAALKALANAAGISHRCTPVFVSATSMWREAMRRGELATTASIADRLVAEYAACATGCGEVADLLMLVEKLNFTYRRRVARHEALSMNAVRAA